MTKVLRFRSNWGVDPSPGCENYKTWLPQLKRIGYAGIEVNLYFLKDLEQLRHVSDDVGFEIIALVYSSWPGAAGPRPSGLTVQDHLNFYRDQLIRAKELRPLKIVANTGSDIWTWDQSVEFYQGSLKIDEEVGLVGKVCHETHRNRSLFNPYATSYILKNVPDLRITADFSHWVVGCERLLDQADEDNVLLSQVFPHVHHIHTRIGTTQASQYPDPSAPIYEAEKTSFENIWKQTIEAQLKAHGPDYIVTYVPEYGPYPYQPPGSVRDFAELADTEGVLQQRLFEAVRVQ